MRPVFPSAEPPAKPSRTAQAEATVKFRWCCGALSIEQVGIPEATPLTMCYPGWQESLAQFAALVEPDMPG
jgi:hypothetical protein